MSAQQRNTRGHRCPICEGADGDPRHKGKRCNGFESSDGKYWHCQREEFAGRIEITKSSETYAHRMNGSCKCGQTHGAEVRSLDTFEAKYVYRDEDGRHLFRVVRAPGKRFFQQSPDGAGGWKSGRDGARWVPYRFPELLDADPDAVVYIAEGEKDVETLARRGLIATCNPCGEGKWIHVANVAAKALKDRDVIVIADNDEVGINHARDVAGRVLAHARSVRVVSAPKPHKDVSDLLGAGGSVADLVPLGDAGEVEAPSNDTPEPPYVIESATEIAEPLPPLEWLCRGLQLARGSLTIVGGYGYSRKTLYAQAMALSVASGTRALDVYNVDRQPALHIDYEQGKRITRERYQRMARAGDIELRDALLSVVTFPRFKLTSNEARDTLRRLLEETGAKFVVLDSLRASLEGVEENSSEIREYIDIVGTECKRVDAAGILIHHARKPTADKIASRYSLRGSSGIFDAPDSIFIFSGEKGQPTTVDHEKDRLVGTELESFGLTSEDVVGENGDPRWGLRLVHQEAQQMRRNDDAKRAAHQAADRIARSGQVESYLQKLPEATWRGTRSDLAKQVGARKADALATIGELVSNGRIVETITGRRTEAIRWVGP